MKWSESMNNTIQIRGHHLLDFHILTLLGADNPTINNLITSYTEAMRQEKINQFKKLTENPEYRVQITGSLDYLCSLNCPRLEAKCSSQRSADIDTFVAEQQYGLVVNRTYSAREILEVLKEKPYRSLMITISTEGQISEGPLSKRPTLYQRITRFFLNKKEN